MTGYICRCAFSRWVHEECAEYVIVDAEGLERFAHL